MNDPVIDRIRNVNPYPVDLAPLPIEPVLRQIAEHSSFPRSPRRRIAVPDLGAVIAALAAGVALAIAVLAFVTIGHRNSAGVGRSGTPGTQMSSVKSEREELLASLSVLRRPQTATDRHAKLPSPFSIGSDLPTAGPATALQKNEAQLRARLSRQAGDPAIDRPLLRRITTPAGDEISVVPETFAPSAKSSTRAEGIAIAIHTPGNQQSVDTGPRPVSVSYFETHGLAVFNDTRRGAVLVPDGVARVTLVGFGETELGARVRMDNAKIAGKTAVVHDNLATFTLAHLTATSTLGRGSFGGGGEVRMIWFNASGRVIAHTTTNVSTLYIIIHGPKGSPFSPGSPPIGRVQLIDKSNRAFADTRGSASLVRRNGQVGLVIDASGLPRTSAGTAYGVWLTNGSATDDRFLGFIASQPRDGRISAQVPLTPSMLRNDSSVELTIEHGSAPASRPGAVVLHGTLP